MYENGPSDGLTAGELVLHYRLINRIGGGGMGEVFLARDEKLDRLVALKTVSAKLAHSPQLKQRLTTEARAGARLSHKNICGIHAIEETESGFFISMEYIQGVTLADLITGELLTSDRIKARLSDVLPEGVLKTPLRLGLAKQLLKMQRCPVLCELLMDDAQNAAGLLLKQSCLL